MKTPRFWLIVLCVLFLLAACGGNEPAVEDPTPEPVVEAPATEAPPPTAVPPSPTPEPTAVPPSPTPEPTNVVTDLEGVQTAVVRIVAEGSFIDPEEGFLLNSAGSGTGFIIDESGIAVTNNHVVTGAALLRVYVSGEDQPRNAKILGVSECSDLAIIDIDGEDFPYFDWYEGDANTGLDVYAAGYPLGDPEFTLTRGIISKAKAAGYTNWSAVAAVLEHDATINPGNSGGPLVTAAGQVVGVNYASNPNYNQYFAIDRREALPVIEQLRDGKDVDSIGVNGVAVGDGDTFSGIWVSSVESGSPADRAGLDGGDIIMQMEGLVLATDGTMEDYCNILRSHNADDVLSIEVMRFASGELLEGQLNGDELVVTETMGAVEATDPDPGPAPESVDLEFVTIYDNDDVIQMEVPTTWNDIDGRPWERDDEIIGAALAASPKLDGFFDSFATPGVFFGASERLAQTTSAAQFLNDQYDWSEFCNYDGRFDYDDGVYIGQYDVYSNCGDEGASFTLLAGLSSDGTHLAFVQVQTVTAADEQALDQILNTFIAHGDLAATAPLQSGDIAYVTEFDDAADWSAFTVPEDGDYAARDSDGVLYIEVPETDLTAYATQDTAFLADVRIDAGVETVAGPNRNNISLVCRYNDFGWYEFSMNSGGYWYIWKYTKGDGFDILNEGASLEINLQRAKNELTAVCQGSSLTLIVNGVEVGSATDSEYESGGIGVSVTTFDIPGAGAEFDWLVVSAP